MPHGTFHFYIYHRICKYVVLLVYYLSSPTRGMLFVYLLTVHRICDMGLERCLTHSRCSINVE